MRRCLWCDCEIKEAWDERGHNPRRYCCLSHKQLAYVARKKAREAADDPNRV